MMKRFGLMGPETCLAITLVAAAVSLGQPAAAADSKGRYAIKGAGVMACESFVAERKIGSPKYYAAVGWLQGYLTGYNRFTEGVYDILPWQNVKVLAASVESYCSKNQTEPLFQVVRLLARSYQPKAITEESILVKAKVGDKAYLIYQETLKRVQSRLQEEGLINDAPDGKFGPGTEQALRAFQKKYKLKQTGLPDETTLYVLLEKSVR